MWYNEKNAVGQDFKVDIGQMGVFDFLKKGKAELSDEQKKWNKMWDLWTEGRADSPYKELMSYQSEVNNGGHDQYFFNIENSGNLQKEMAVLKTVLPAKLRDNLQNAYDAYLKLTNEESDEQAGTILSQYDDEFYKGEEEINCILRAYASKIGS